MVYMQASIKLHAGKLPDFIALINELSPVLARHGIKLMGSYATVAGRLNTVVDWWEMPEPNALTKLMGEPEMAKFAPRIATIIEDEVISILTKLPIG